MIQGGKRLITVKGPLGAQIVVVLPPVILDPPSTEVQALKVTVHDSGVKLQKRAWGLTRSLIANAVEGVSKGYTTDLRLVGVGYRAAIEPIPEEFRRLQSQIPKKVKQTRPGSAPVVDLPAPTHRLNIKLGYSHPVLIDIPADIQVEIPAPTKIQLKGIDKHRLGVFAARIRDWRKPEPYRGKVSLSVPYIPVARRS